MQPAWGIYGPGANQREAKGAFDVGLQAQRELRHVLICWLLRSSGTSFYPHWMKL